MVRKEVSKIDSHIDKVVGVETSTEPSIVVDLNTHHSFVLGGDQVFLQNSEIEDAPDK